MAAAVEVIIIIRDQVEVEEGIVVTAVITIANKNEFIFKFF